MFGLSLLAPSALAELSRAAQTFHPTASDLASFEARASSAGPTRLLSTNADAGLATIEVVGILSERRSLLAELFGGGSTSYAEIRSSLRAADADPEVTRVELVIDSPGGNVDGLFETIAAVEAFSKPLTVRASNAQSAAYILAAAAGQITATTAASSFGSLGVAATFFVSDRVVDIASTDAPNKRPDVRTDAGKAVVREYLDQVHALCVETVATGRGVPKARANAEFGRGGTLLAGEALRRGMIDAIATGNASAGSASAHAANHHTHALCTWGRWPTNQERQR